MATATRNDKSHTDELVKQLRELIRQEQERPREIVPDRLYKPEDAARLLGITSERAAQTLAAMPDLPYVPTGPSGGLKRYHGRDLLRFIERRKVKPGGIRDED